MLHRIRNVDRRVDVIDAEAWFDVESAPTPEWTVDRYLGDRKHTATSLRESAPRTRLSAGDHRRGQRLSQLRLAFLDTDLWVR